MNSIGDRLRDWRRRRRLSQLDLALDAGISARHLSFLETGRSRPSREMVLRLADRLKLPLRACNELLIAAGFAPSFPERKLDDPGLSAARRAVELVLKGHEPFPALAVDRRWTLVAANAALTPLLEGVDPVLLKPPVNVLRLSLHPAGLATRIANLTEWREHLFERIRRDIELTADEELGDLLEELAAYPGAAARRRPSPPDHGKVAVPLRIRSGKHELAFISTTTVFGTPLDITLSELAIESFLPADEATARLLLDNRAASVPVSAAEPRAPSP